MDNLIGYINLNDTENYQAIYNSQLYGTFFSIYAKFTKVKSAKDDMLDHHKLEKIDFKIINYKGLLNIGIVDAGDLENLGDKHKIRLQVQALGGSNCISVSCKNYKIKIKDTFIVERELIKMHRNGEALYAGLFDDEFYYREGLPNNGEYKERSPKPNDTIEPSFLDNTPILKNPGSICPRSISFVV